MWDKQSIKLKCFHSTTAYIGMNRKKIVFGNCLHEKRNYGDLKGATYEFISFSFLRNVIVVHQFVVVDIKIHLKL